MSKNESNATEWYCKQLNGHTVYEFLAVQQNTTENKSRRLVDAVVINPGSGYMKVKGADASMGEQDVVIVQTKAKRLSMSVIGQALCSIELLKVFGPRSMKSVIVCKETDAALEPICDLYGLEVVLAPEEIWKKN